MELSRKKPINRKDRCPESSKREVTYLDHIYEVEWGGSAVSFNVCLFVLIKLVVLGLSFEPCRCISYCYHVTTPRNERPKTATINLLIILWVD